MELIHKDLTGQIIAAAISVQNELKPGLSEKIYEKALCIELTERGISYEQQTKFEVFYKGQNLGYLIPDLVVDKKIIVDTKCVDSFNPTHDAQMLGYLNITGLSLALLLNFKIWPLGKRRILRPEFNNLQH
ncbi:MAG: GxxExxY protein [Akkermansiaceae bacterium]|jgi:GxxExxY protein